MAVGVDLCQLSCLKVTVTICYHVDGVIVVNTPMYVVCGRVGGYIAQGISFYIEEVLPRMNAIVATWRAPFDKKELIGIFDITWCLVDLVG